MKYDRKKMVQLLQDSPAFRDKLTPKMTKYIPHIPYPKQQAFLLLDDVLDVFYGGAVGGGKSDALLMAALQYVDVPGYAALIVRATYKDLSLPGAIMDRAKSWLASTDAVWNDTNKKFTFPSGATLSFGYLDGPDDHYQYQSAEFHFVGVDEASQLRWNQVLYLFSRMRRTIDIPVPIRFRCASNPGGRSHVEVKKRYIDKKTRGNRIFIPAGLEDNPYLDHEQYKEALKNLSPLDQERLVKGRWDVIETGGKFSREWFVRRNNPLLDKEYPKLLRFWDLAATKPKSARKKPDWTVGVKLGLDRDDRVWILDVRRVQRTPRQVERLIQHVSQVDGHHCAVRMEQEPGSSGKSVIATYQRLLSHYNFKGIPSSGSKEEYAKPASAACENGQVIVLNARPWLEDFFTELELFPNGDWDDQVDAFSKGYAELKDLKVKRKKIGVLWTS